MHTHSAGHGHVLLSEMLLRASRSDLNESLSERDIFWNCVAVRVQVLAVICLERQLALTGGMAAGEALAPLGD